MKSVQILAIIIKDGGGVEPVFVQRVPALPAYYIVFFHSPKHGSTLCLRIKGLTPDIVKKHINESNVKFGVA